MGIGYPQVDRKTTGVKIEIYIPTTHLEEMREALRSVDAGHIGYYDSAMNYSKVNSCWRTLPGASPFNGEIGKLSEAEEYKIEVHCMMENLEKTVAAIRAAHPYEEPQINAIPLLHTGMTY